MSIIKFRAWDCEELEIIPPDSLLTLYNNRYLNESLVSDNKVTLMQFTGLIDKNGAEIYEGDIVKVYQHDEYLFNHRVEWSDANGCCSISVNHCDYDLTTMAWAEQQFCYEYEVIGNIYKNPKLREQNL